MSGHEPSLPMTETTSTPSARNLWLRVASAAVLAPLAVGAAWLGGLPFTVFWTVAAVAVWWEWVGLVRPSGRHVVLATGASALLLEAVLFEAGNFTGVAIIFALGTLAAIVTAGRHALLIGGGMLYASAVLIAPVVLRSDPALGLAAIVFLFAVVWGTDIGGYFAGRGFGGPKLAPAISPKKTWSGAIGGTIIAISAAFAVASAFSVPLSGQIVLVALCLSIGSQSGDLFESWLKRKFNAKDSSGLIPGHGGVMDRLDGFVIAAALAALLGVLRGGFDAPAAALFAW